MPRKVRRRESREGRRIPRTSTTPKPRRSMPRTSTTTRKPRRTTHSAHKYDDEKAAKDDEFRARVRRRSREGRCRANVRRQESREGRRIPRTSTTPKPRRTTNSAHKYDAEAAREVPRKVRRRESREGRRIPRTSTTPKPRRSMPRKRTTTRKPRRTTNSAQTYDEEKAAKDEFRALCHLCPPMPTYAHLCHLCHLCCLRPFFLVLSITFRRYCRRLHLLRFFSSCFPVSVCVRSAGSVLCCSVVSGGFRLRRALGSGPAIPVDVSSR
ncbi:hypothetical protein BDB00DRAFT_35112 [Zychaea mexicana]|uniref:uncharacterized protein n=1 Tax=Zychaea mexicana TaxID=64656 RepID=UPI0022FDD7C4|nr:uncharacterized protein BDB00DRAFT_35112 [Zychaea mexicana]KAI9488669.1 hypothetical protein BDB00DRAFT_35112 [Zychaea mexicana]